MKKVIVLTLMSLFFAFPSFSSPIGKGLICKYIQKKPSALFSHYLAFEFSKKTVYYYNFNLANNNTNTTSSSEFFYTTKPKSIIINDNGTRGNAIWYLNRETLILSKSENYNSEHDRKCDVFSKIEFNSKFKELRKMLQNNFDAQTVKNKI